MTSFFFNDWNSLWRVVLVGVLAYLALILFLRVSGKRTLSKMNAFDFVVTIALGSTLAAILLNKQVALAEGLLALALLIGLQYGLAWLSVRSPRVRSWIRDEPRLLVSHGCFLRSAMRDARINEGEIRQALRREGFASVEEAEAVVLETDGGMSILPRAEKGEGTLSNVQRE